jgi:hypothetical protein
VVEVKSREPISHEGWVVLVRQLRRIAIVIVVLALAILTGCGSDEAASPEERVSSVVEECREHGGVSALEDYVVICRDQTASEDRGSRAVEACRAHGGVVAFDDDIAICRDQTFQEAGED